MGIFAHGPYPQLTHPSHHHPRNSSSSCSPSSQRLLHLRARTHTHRHACMHTHTDHGGGLYPWRSPSSLSLPSFFFLLQHTMLRRFRILIFWKAASTLRLVGMQTQELEGTFFSLFCDLIHLSFLGREKSCMKSTQANSKQEQLLHFSSRFSSEARLTEERTYRPKLGRRVGAGMRKWRKEESL